MSAAAAAETEDIPSESVPPEPEVSNVAVDSESVDHVSVEGDSVARSVSQHDAGASDHVAEATPATIAGGGCSDDDDFSDDGATEQVRDIKSGTLGLQTFKSIPTFHLATFHRIGVKWV